MLQIRSWHSTTDTPPVIVISTGAADRPRVRRTLSQAGFAITALASVEDYLRSRPTTDSHCIVCDPAIEGLALQTATATVESTTAIIFVTSNADPRMALRALKGGAVDYLIEPFKGPELVSAVRRGSTNSARCELNSRNWRSSKHGLRPYRCGKEKSWQGYRPAYKQSR